MFKIYCVEDDESIRELIVYALNNGGFNAKGFEDGDKFFSKVRKNIPNNIPDLILLDIMLPGESGLEILKKLKKDSSLKNIPVIMITAKTSEFDKVTGLDMGADDYISKPFGVMELISRVKALLRRTSISQTSNNLSINGVSIDYKRRILMVDEKKVDLTYKEFELLYFLLENKDIVLTRDSIMNKVWGVDFEGETRTVDVHIASIRQKLGDKGKIIQTIRNVGYKLGSVL